MKIDAMEMGGRQYFNITGGKLKSKFSIHETPSGYSATAAKGNAELIQFLNSQSSLTQNYEWEKGYWGWEVDFAEVVTVINAVIREFE